MKLFGIKFNSDCIEWGEYAPDYYAYYFFFKPHWLSKDVRHWGIQKMYYDGPHVSLGFWFFNFSWSTQWSTFDWDKD